LCKLLAHQIIKFCGIENGSFRLQPLNTLLETTTNAATLNNYFENLKLQFNQPNRRVQRWIKKLMEMMIRESVRAMNNPKDCLFFLNAFHTIYITTIFTMEPASFYSTLDDFTRKLILLQMKMVKTFKGDQDVLASVLEFIRTIEQHQKEDEDLITSLSRIKKHEMLQVVD
jgi:hypothetical protein